MYAHLCLFTYACCALSVLKRLAAKQTRDFRPTSQRQDAVKTDFNGVQDFFVAPTDACFPSSFSLSFYFHDYFQPFRRNIRLYTGFPKRFHVSLLYRRWSIPLSKCSVFVQTLFRIFYRGNSTLDSSIFCAKSVFLRLFIYFNNRCRKNWKLALVIFFYF